jgi:hypothetical protein
VQKRRSRRASDSRSACVVLVRTALIAGAATLFASGTSAANLALQVSSETAPPGGWAQI